MKWAGLGISILVLVAGCIGEPIGGPGSDGAADDTVSVECADNMSPERSSLVPVPAVSAGIHPGDPGDAGPDGEAELGLGDADSGDADGVETADGGEAEVCEWPADIDAFVWVNALGFYGRLPGVVEVHCSDGRYGSGSVGETFSPVPAPGDGTSFDVFLRLETLADQPSIRLRGYSIGTVGAQRELTHYTPTSLLRFEAYDSRGENVAAAIHVRRVVDGAPDRDFVMSACAHGEEVTSGAIEWSARYRGAVETGSRVLLEGESIRIEIHFDEESPR